MTTNLQPPCANFTEHATPIFAHGVEQVKNRRLVERKTHDTMRPLNCNSQRYAAAIGVANQVNRPVGRVDGVDDSARLVGEAERPVAAPPEGCATFKQVGR